MNFPLFFQVEGQLNSEMIAFDLDAWEKTDLHPDASENPTVVWRRKWEAINPAALDSEERIKECLANIDGDPVKIGIKVGGSEWAEIIGRDVEHVVKSDAICLLPGWQYSKGAKIEAFVAWQCGKEIYEYDVEIGDTYLFRIAPDDEYFKMKVNL